jgi:hypothetical protein
MMQLPLSRDANERSLSGYAILLFTNTISRFEEGNSVNIPYQTCTEIFYVLVAGDIY